MAQPKAMGDWEMIEASQSSEAGHVGGRTQAYELPPEATLVNGQAVSTGDTPLNNLAAAVRRIIDVIVGRPLEEQDCKRAEEKALELAEFLEGKALAGKRPRGIPDGTGHPQDYFPTSPVVGYQNPISPPVNIWTVIGEDGTPELRGHVNFSYAYEGPPTCVHGGVIAELFDELLGSANTLTMEHVAGMTGTLSIRYRSPTPILTDLDLVARRVKVEGRKIFVWGGIYHEGVLTAEAEGIFIQVDGAKMMAMFAANSREAQGAVIDPQLGAYMAEQGIKLSDDPNSK